MSTQEKKTVIGLPLVLFATADEPAQLLSSGMVLGLYNVHHDRNDENKETKVTEKIKDWLSEEAIKAGWAEVTWTGSQALLNSVATPEVQEVKIKPTKTKAPDRSQPAPRSSAGSAKRLPENMKSAAQQSAEDFVAAKFPRN